VNELFARIQYSGCPKNALRSFILSEKRSLNQEHTGIKTPIGLGKLFVEECRPFRCTRTYLSSALGKSAQAMDGVSGQM
jgi:hypothetical protein